MGERARKAGEEGKVQGLLDIGALTGSLQVQISLMKSANGLLKVCYKSGVLNIGCAVSHPSIKSMKQMTSRGYYRVKFFYKGYGD